MESKKLQYFASLPTNEIGGELVRAKDTYYEHLEKIGHFTLLKLAHHVYYKASYINGRLRRTGENLEYVELAVNHYRNLIQHVLSMITSQRPQFEPKAANTDYKSMTQAQLASGLLEYYMRAKRLERFIKNAAEGAINYGEGWVYLGWDAMSGEQYGKTENGAPIYEGDIQCEYFTPLDIIRDVTRTNGPQLWYQIRRFKNKYDLAAKYPELAERILATNPETYQDMRFSFRELKEKRKDDIPVYMFLHNKSEAVPNGRITEWIDSDLILTDGPLPYREMPLYCLSPGDKDGSVFGYTNAWDILPMQQAIDKLHSTVVTNQAAFGVQNIMVPKGNDLDVTQLAGGLNMIEYDPKAGPPSPLQLTSTPVEVFNYITMLEQSMETLIGVNSVARGNPEQNLKSGAALALVQSLSIQFNQSLQQNYAMFIEELGTAIINLLRDYATVPRIAMIAGKSNRTRMKEFKGDDLSKINRVLVDMGNPLMRTTAGRVEVANQLIQGGLVKNPQQYLEVLTTGRLEPMYESELSQLNLIKAENEALQEGRPVPVLRTDDHEMHIKEHNCLFSSPEAREIPELLAVSLQHIEEHEQYLLPLLAAAEQEATGVENPANPMIPVNPTEQNAANVKLPNMPTIAGTNQKAG